ncbi:hypothetical protein B0H10DRAFT_1290495 [Mycena sp. CBHHK59/15]|nr:hypothetical protein B0H10DRAFT_1290495 [Mycena sp. CBHHK59/15]
MESSPAVRIPFEITSRIFRHCLSTNGRIRPDRRAAPLLLSQICRHWRSVALSTGELWCSIALEFSSSDVHSGLSPLFGDSEPQALDYSRATIDLWFNRAAGHPLSLTLKCTDKFTELPAQVLAAIVIYSVRCCRIELEIPVRDLVQIQTSQAPFPVLKTLAISSSPLAAPLTFAESYGLLTAKFHPAPNLKKLRLLKFIRSAPYISVGSVSLTNLEVHEMVTVVGCADIFLRFPQLLHLSLTQHARIFGSNGMSGGLTEVQPPPLQSLRLHGGIHMLELTRLPTLQSLTLLLCGEADAARLLAFFSASACQLTHLALSIMDDVYRIDPQTDCTLQRCLESVSTLRTLQMRATVPDFPIARYYSLLAQPALLPALHTLHLFDFAGANHSYLPLIRLLPRGFGRMMLVLRVAGASHVPAPLGGGIKELGVRYGVSIQITTPTLRWPGGTSHYAEPTEHDIFPSDGNPQDVFPIDPVDM